MYLILPETENHTLEDIELHFSDNKRKLTDRKIQKVGQLNAAHGLSSTVATAETAKSQLDSFVDPVTYVNEVKKTNGVNGMNGHCNESYLHEK